MLPPSVITINNINQSVFDLCPYLKVCLVHENFPYQYYTNHYGYSNKLTQDTNVYRFQADRVSVHTPMTNIYRCYR